MGDMADYCREQGELHEWLDREESPDLYGEDPPVGFWNGRPWRVLPKSPGWRISGGCYCGADLVLRRSKFGLFYSCKTWPKCDGAVGAHQASGDPLGVAANKETRRARKALHDLLDRHWRNKAERKACYGTLAYQMGIKENACHVALFGLAECARALKIVKEW